MVESEVLDKLDLKIRFGPAGIPLGCKGRTLKDGIKDVRHLGLDVMEIQLLVGVGKPIPHLEAIKEMAELKDVTLTVHAPYYMDLLGSPKDVARGISALKWAGEMAHKLGAGLVVTHIGLYHDHDNKEALELAVKNIRKVRDYYKSKGYNVKLGLEPNGKRAVFGTFEEILTIAKRVSNTVPILSYPHIHARCGGCLRNKEAFMETLEAVYKVTKEPKFYIIFSGVEHDGAGNMIKLAPIKKGDMKFEHLAECILDHMDWEYTIISISPLLEHDALYMKVILERVQLKREAKAARAALKGKSD